MMAGAGGAGTGGPGPLALRALRDVVLSGDPACAGDPELFTGPSGVEPEDEPEPERTARIDAARAVCQACPVRLACLAYALRILPAEGVWAGLVPEEIAFLAGAAGRPARPDPAAGSWPGQLAEVA